MADSPSRPRRQASLADEVNESMSAENEKAVPDWQNLKGKLGVKRPWTLGIKADKLTDEVPGTVLLLSKYSTKNIPLGLHHEQQLRGRLITRGSMSGEADRRRSSISSECNTKKTTDGRIVLEPQPDDSLNDPLNWPDWRRNAALLSLGFYCMLGGGMTPILAAGFSEIVTDLHVSYADVARTTGLYMLGLGVGGVIVSPTAILYGKRPVYLASSILFVVTSIWCGIAPTYAQLATARVFQGIAVSPVEVLPSATIAEIFFLHERAFRVGIYTLLLIGGKNLIPLISAVIIQGLSWRWVFYIVAVIVGFGGISLFFFAPETFWDRMPRPKTISRSSVSKMKGAVRNPTTTRLGESTDQHHISNSQSRSRNPALKPVCTLSSQVRLRPAISDLDRPRGKPVTNLSHSSFSAVPQVAARARAHFAEDDANLPHLHNLNSPYYVELEKNHDYLDSTLSHTPGHNMTQPLKAYGNIPTDLEKRDPPSNDDPVWISSEAGSQSETPKQAVSRTATGNSYTTNLRQIPQKSYLQTLRPWNGRLTRSVWWKAAVRPLILYAYPSVLWSALVYSLSIGWLIVISESVSNIYKNRTTYNFTSLQIGLVYLSPFIGAILGTAVAGKLSDIVVRFMARRNDGIYEPEYRLVMTLPIAVTTVAGLMGFGWSAQEHDAWIVPTIFFGLISFGCALGSTTSITFCVDSYRQYAGEALVTLNFSKNILHGLIWSLFFPEWLEDDGPKDVFISIGGIQLICLLATIPMYIYGKKARMWTVRKGMMDRF